jgi:hypothetical protein
MSLSGACAVRFDSAVAQSNRDVLRSRQVLMFSHGLGPSRRFAATQHLGRFQSEADIDCAFMEGGFMSTRPSHSAFRLADPPAGARELDAFGRLDDPPVVGVQASSRCGCSGLNELRPGLRRLSPTITSFGGIYALRKKAERIGSSDIRSILQSATAGEAGLGSRRAADPLKGFPCVRGKRKT